MKDKYFIIDEPIIEAEDIMGPFDSLREAIDYVMYSYGASKENVVEVLTNDLVLIKGHRVDKKCIEVSFKAIERELS